MWLHVTEQEFNAIATTLRAVDKGYEYHTGDYTHINVKDEDLKKYLPLFYKRWSIEKYNKRIKVYGPSNNWTVWDYVAAYYQEWLKDNPNIKEGSIALSVFLKKYYYPPQIIY